MMLFCASRRVIGIWWSRRWGWAHSNLGYGWYLSCGPLRVRVGRRDV